MNTAKIAKHNFNQALTWLIYVHLAAVYYLDSSALFLAIRGYMQWNLSNPSLPITLRGSMMLIVAVTLICALRRLHPSGGPGMIIDFIGIAPGSGPLLLLFYDIVIGLLQLLMLISIYQSTNELDNYSHGSSLLASYSNRSNTPSNRWWMFSRRDQSSATASRDSMNIGQVAANGTSTNNNNDNIGNDMVRNARLAHLAEHCTSTTRTMALSPQSTETDDHRMISEGEERNPVDYSNDSGNSNGGPNSDDYSTGNTRRRGIDRLWSASQFRSNQARYERLENTVPDRQDNGYEEQLDRYYNVSIEAYDLGGLFVINCCRTIRQNWMQCINDNGSASSERRPLPI